MKKLITIGYVTALVMSGIGFAKADNITVSVNEMRYPNSHELCQIGVDMFRDGVGINDVLEALKSSPIHVEDKLIIINCFIAERDKV